MSSLLWAWSASPTVLVPAAVAVLLFLKGFVRLRRRGRRDHAPLSRLILFLAAVVLATLAVISPLDTIGDEYLLSAHMVQHLVLFDVAPVLMLLALRRPLLFFFVPPAVLRTAGRGSLRRAVAVVGRPEAALLATLLVYGFWQLPSTYDYALGHPAVHAVEHAMLFTAGFLVWRQVLDPEAGAHRSRYPALWCGGFCAAGLVASGALVLSSSTLYGPYAAQPERLFGISPLFDQQLAGLVLLSMQIVMLAVGLRHAPAPMVSRTSKPRRRSQRATASAP